MVVRDCRFEDTDAGIRLKSGRDRGGLVEDITYENLTMKHVKIPILVTSYYPEIPEYPENDPAMPITPKTPIWRHVRISDVTAEDSLTGAEFIGLAEMPIQDFVLTNVHVSGLNPMRIIRAQGLQFVNSEVKATSGKPVQIYDSTVEGLNDAAQR